MPLDVRECRRERLDDLAVDRADHLVQLTTGIFYVLELAFQELVALLQRGQLFASERVDRSEQSQLAVEFPASLSGIGTRGQLGTARGERFGGQGVEIAGERIDRGLVADARLGGLDLEALAPIGQARERAFQRLALDGGSPPDDQAHAPRSPLVGHGRRVTVLVALREPLEAALQGGIEAGEGEILRLVLVASVFDPLAFGTAASRAHLAGDRGSRPTASGARRCRPR